MIRNLAFKICSGLSRRAYTTFRKWYPELDIKSEYKALKKLKHLAGLDEKQVPCCPNSCMAFTGRNAELARCFYCERPRLVNGKASMTYTCLPLSDLLAFQWRHSSTAEALHYRQRYDRYHDPNIIDDVFASDRYARMKTQRVKVHGHRLDYTYYSHPLDMAIGLFTDGFQLFDRRQASCWPVIATNLSLPPEIRTQSDNVLTLMIIPGYPKDLDSFLFPLVQELQDIARDGFGIYDAYTAREETIRAFVHFVTGDGPALAKLLKTKGSNGMRPCKSCTIQATLSGRHYYPVLQAPLLHQARDPPSMQGEELVLRTHRQMVRQGREVARSGNDQLSKEYGIGGPTILSKIPGFDLPRASAVDFMHLMFENVMKILLRLWTGKKEGLAGDYIVPEKTWKDLDLAVQGSYNKVPALYGRRLPPLLRMGDWTAEDYSNFLLYSGPIILQDCWPDNPRYYIHFLELSDIAEKCLGFEMRRQDVQAGGSLRLAMQDWVRQYEE